VTETENGEEPTDQAPSKKRTPNATLAKYPRHSVERALRIPKAILDQNAGKPVTPEEAAVLLGVTTAKAPFSVEISSALKYGFLARQGGKIELTDLARRILRPNSAEDEIKAYREAVLLPREERDRVTSLDELYGFLEQSHISQKNIDRLGILTRHADSEVRKLADLVLDIARVKPYRRRRLKFLAKNHRSLVLRLQEAYEGDRPEMFGPIDEYL
jgi:hypothetical protein